MISARNRSCSARFRPDLVAPGLGAEAAQRGAEPARLDAVARAARLAREVELEPAQLDDGLRHVALAQQRHALLLVEPQRLPPAGAHPRVRSEMTCVR